MLVSVLAMFLSEYWKRLEESFWKRLFPRFPRNDEIYKKNPNTEGFRLMLLFGPGNNSYEPKITLAKFVFYVGSNKINSPWNRISQILVIVLKNRSNEIRSNEICIRQEPPVLQCLKINIQDHSSDSNSSFYFLYLTSTAKQHF